MADATRRPPFTLVRRASLTSAICQSKEVTIVMPASTSSVPKFNNWPSSDACDDFEENREKRFAKSSTLIPFSTPSSLPSPPSHRPDFNNMVLQARDLDPKLQTPNLRTANFKTLKPKTRTLKHSNPNPNPDFGVEQIVLRRSAGTPQTSQTYAACTKKTQKETATNKTEGNEKKEEKHKKHIILQCWM